MHRPLVRLVRASLAILLLSAELPDRGLEEALAALGSASSAERLSAERWLATHLVEDDYPLLAEAASSGDAETRTRLVRALGSDDRNLGLAVYFAGESRPELRSLGRAALEEMLLRWSPVLDRPPLTRTGLRDRLLELHDEYRPAFLELDLSEPLSPAVDRIARRGSVPLALVVDPSLDDPAAGALGLPGVIVARGIWDQLLVFLAERDGLGLEGHGLGRDDEDFVRGFVRVCRRRDEGRRSGADLVLEWLHDAAHHEQPARRAAAARALAATGWPAAIQWLGLRWDRTGDDWALDGSLVAAARGRVSAALTTPAAVARLLARAEAGLGQGPAAGAADRARAWRIVDALGALPPIGAAGASLAEPLVDGWSGTTGTSGLSGLARWLRLAVAEGMRPADSALAGHVDELLADAGAAPVLRRQALRVRVALGERVGRPLPELPSPLRFFDELEAADEYREVARLLLLCGAVPPADLAGRAAAAVQAGEVSLEDAVLRSIALAEWSLGAGAPEAAADHLAAARLGAAVPGDDDWFASGSRRARGLAAEVLRDRAFRGEREGAAGVLAALESRELAAGTRRRLALVSGLLPDGEHAALAAAVVSERAAADPEALGALAAGPARDVGLSALVAGISERLADPATSSTELDAWRLGLERAVEELLLAGLDRRAEGFLGELGAVAREHDQSHLAARLLQSDWPPPPRLRARRLRALDRRLGPGELASLGS